MALLEQSFAQDLAQKPATSDNVEEEAPKDESPWPDFVNITVYEGAGYCLLDFIKFSVEEKGTYICGYPTIMKLKGVENLPSTGVVRDPETGYYFWVSVETTKQKFDWISLVPYSNAVATFEQKLKSPEISYVNLYEPKESPFPERLTAFLAEFGPKLENGSLEITEYIYVPPVWRKQPLKSGIKVQTVEQWNREHGFEKE